MCVSCAVRNRRFYALNVLCSNTLCVGHGDKYGTGSACGHLFLVYLKTFTPSAQKEIPRGGNLQNGCKRDLLLHYYHHYDVF